MGNSFGWNKRKSAKVMKIDGTTFKLKPPATAKTALEGHPGYVLMESEDVKRLGVKAKPLDPDHTLKSNKLYFLVELPKPPSPKPQVMGARRIRSGINMTAKDRLESLMLSRRAVSDISAFARVPAAEGEAAADGGVRVRMRLPKSEVARLVRESGDSSEAAAKIMELCAQRKKWEGGGSASGGGGEKVENKQAVTGSAPLKREKRMRFAPVETEIIG